MLKPRRPNSHNRPSSISKLIRIGNILCAVSDTTEIYSVKLREMATSGSIANHHPYTLLSYKPGE
jgi:hypothetical protein